MTRAQIVAHKVFVKEDGSAIIHPKENTVLMDTYIGPEKVAELAIAHFHNDSRPLLATGHSFDQEKNLVISQGPIKLQMSLEQQTKLVDAIQSNLERVAEARAHQLRAVMPAYQGGVFAGGLDQTTLKNLAKAEMAGKLEITLPDKPLPGQFGGSA